MWNECQLHVSYSLVAILYRTEHVHNKLFLDTVARGLTADCPAPNANEGAVLCNNDMNFCVDGVCSGSLCLAAGYTDCQCTEVAQQCHLCCMKDGECMSSQVLSDVAFQLRESGRSCNNFAGYCDSNGM